MPVRRKPENTKQTFECPEVAHATTVFLISEESVFTTFFSAQIVRAIGHQRHVPCQIGPRGFLNTSSKSNV